jgi:hypothetical protein
LVRPFAKKKSQINEKLNQQLKADGLSRHLEVLEEEIDLKPHLIFFYKAYIRLSSDRNTSMGLEAIPWSSMYRYSKHYKLSKNTSEFLFEAISRMDREYIEKKNEHDELKLKRKK